MRRNIWIPPEEYEAIKKAAAIATDTKGVGAYLVLLHKQETARRGRGFHE